MGGKVGVYGVRVADGGGPHAGLVMVSVKISPYTNVCPR